jgi:hypothetical protein
MAAQAGQNKKLRPYMKNNRTVVQVLKHLPRNNETLSSNASTTKIFNLIKKLIYT